MKTISYGSVLVILGALCLQRRRLLEQKDYWDKASLDNGFTQQDITSGREAFRDALEDNAAAIRDVEAFAPEKADLSFLKIRFPEAAELFAATKPVAIEQGDAQ